MEKQAQKTIKCPYCKEEILHEAVKCKHCQSVIVPETPTHGGTCPYCKEQINKDAIKCKHCKSCFRPIADVPYAPQGMSAPGGPCGPSPIPGASAQMASSPIPREPGFSFGPGGSVLFPHHGIRVLYCEVKCEGYIRDGEPMQYCWEECVVVWD